MYNLIVNVSEINDLLIMHMLDLLFQCEQQKMYALCGLFERVICIRVPTWHCF